MKHCKPWWCSVREDCVVLLRLRRLIACPSVGLSPMWRLFLRLYEDKWSPERRSLRVYSWSSGAFIGAKSDSYITQLIVIIFVLVVRKMPQLHFLKSKNSKSALYWRYYPKRITTGEVHICVAWRLGNSASKKRRSGDEPLATLRSI